MGEVRVRTFSLASYTHREALRSGVLTQSFLAVHHAYAQRVVLKQLLPTFATNRDIRERWLVLAAANQTLAAADRSIVLESGESDGAAYLAVEHVAGLGLDVLLRQQSGAPVEPGVAVRIASAILEQLASAQERGLNVAHLDVAPHSVIVRDDGAVVLTEHGLWNALSPAEGARVRFDRGRVPYLSPELAKSLAGDLRSDVFSTGCILFELLTGSRPFAGNTQLVLALAIAEGKRKTLHELGTKVPEHLRHVVEAMMAHAPEERFQSARAALNALASGFAPGPSAREQLAAWVARVRQAGGSALAQKTPHPLSGTSDMGHGRSTGSPPNAAHPSTRTRAFGALGEPERRAVSAPPIRVDERRVEPPHGHPATDVLDMAHLLGQPRASTRKEYPAEPQAFAAGPAGPEFIVDDANRRSESLAPPPMLAMTDPFEANRSAPPSLADYEALAAPPMMGEPTPPASPPLFAAPGLRSQPGLGSHESGSLPLPQDLASRDGHTAFFKRANAKHKQAIFVSTPLPPPPPAAPAASPPLYASPPAALATPALLVPVPTTPSPGSAAWQVTPPAGNPAAHAAAQPAFDVALAPLPRTDDVFRDPSGTLFQMKSYAKARTAGEKRKMPLAVAVALAAVFGFVVVTGGYLLYRLLS
jgi:serine/threonine-protein kinase